MSSAADGKAGLAEELRRRRTALGWTLEQVAAQAQVSVSMLSLIETGKRRPSLRSWERIRRALGISEPLPEEAWRQQPRDRPLWPSQPRPPASRLVRSGWG